MIVIYMDNLICEVCNKSFDNYRKLNGHKSSHQDKRRGRSKKYIGIKSKYDVRKDRQNFHDCKFCGKIFETGSKLGGHVSHCPERPDYEDLAKSRKFHCQRISKDPNTREKIRSSVREYLIKNPNKIPYLKNHASKKSFPELIFEQLLIDNGITGWTYNFRVGTYIFDYAFPDLKLDIEIDGSQHKQPRLVEHDKRRDEFSRSLGWTVKRYEAKLVKDKSTHYTIIEEIKQLIKDLTPPCPEWPKGAAF
jgi:very-short-patch-repair endonuclease